MGGRRLYLPHFFPHRPNDRWTSKHLVQMMGVTSRPDKLLGSTVKLDNERKEAFIRTKVEMAEREPAGLLKRTTANLAISLNATR